MSARTNHDNGGWLGLYLLAYLVFLYLGGEILISIET